MQITADATAQGGLVTTDFAHRYLAVSRAMFLKLVASGQVGPKYKLGRCARFRLSDLVDYISRQSVEREDRR
jgi:predicted DNA-binding transcriptional regulator AlpA